MNLATIEAFNNFAEQYADFTFSSILQYELNRFIAFLPKDAKILDLACGSGRDVQYFLDYNYEVIGIDASENMIKDITYTNMPNEILRPDIKLEDDDIVEVHLKD